MATLTPLLPNAAVVNATNQWGVGSYTDIDEGFGGGSDGNEVGDDSNAGGDYYGRYALSNVDADFSSMDTVSVQLEYRVIGAQTNNRSLYVRIVTDEATPTALTSEATVATNITATGDTNYGPTSLTITGTPTKAQWDNAVIQFRLNIVKNKGGDTNGIRIERVAVTGTYTAAATWPEAFATLGLSLDESATGWRQAQAGATQALSLSITGEGWAIGAGSASLGFSLDQAADGWTQPQASAVSALALDFSADGWHQAQADTTQALALDESATGLAPVTMPEGFAALGLSLDETGEGWHQAQGAGIAALALDEAGEGWTLSAGNGVVGLDLDQAAEGWHQAQAGAGLALSLDESVEGWALPASSGALGLALDESATGEAPTVGAVPEAFAALGLGLDAPADGWTLPGGYVDSAAALGILAESWALPVAGAAAGLAIDSAAGGYAQSAGAAALPLGLDSAAVGESLPLAVPGEVDIVSALPRRLAAYPSRRLELVSRRRALSINPARR